jgi:dTDP-4-dehydrorhamnose reductase
MRILITGGHGYIGRNLARLFEQDKRFIIFAPSKEKLNLLHPNEIKQIIDNIQPDIIIHAAIKGGTIIDNDTLNDLADNVKMYENLMAFVPETSIVFILGSGSEFDRRTNIIYANEDEIETCFPVDPYGLAKNIISRRALSEHKNTYVVRLFGCFNHDEEPFRFIKQCIINIGKKIPINIHQDKMMDFFYMDDVFTVITSIITSGGNRNMNLVYPEKYSLLDVASVISQAAGYKSYPLNLESPVFGLSYTGDGTRLEYMKLNFIGLEEGIVRTCKALL